MLWRLIRSWSPRKLNQPQSKHAHERLGASDTCGLGLFVDHLRSRILDTTAFTASLDELFIGDWADGRPRDPRFDEIVNGVDGFSTAAQLAVLNLAARSLPLGEAYLEIGTFKGRSLCGATLDVPGCRFFAVENFMEFGMAGADARNVLLTNLELHARDVDLHLLEGDAFTMLAPDNFDQPVGVYFYDGVHTGAAHHLALALVEPLLADEAIVLVDDASWPMVERATERYLVNHRDWSMLRTFSASANDDPAWANGLMVLAYRRSGAVAAVPPADRLRQKFQVSVRGPANALTWRTLHRFPQLVPIAKRVLPTRSRTVR